jgi:hypothetical protein
VANPGTTVDIIGANNRADEFLHQVVFLIGAAGRRNACNGVRPMWSEPLEVFGYEIVGFIPGYRFQHAIPRIMGDFMRSGWS